MTDTVTVDISEGTLRGKKASTKSGKPYYSFQGIPYAKPPLGPLRFKVAQPPESWSGIRDALKEGSTCTQFDLVEGTFHGTEDSLYINVYSPKIPSRGCENLQLPVMFWIHGGAFMSGSGNSILYGPDYLLEEGVVIVTFNYRLGILGFLSLEDPVAPGNIGLKVQVAALRWVQKNINKFGGDPNNVTIFGESAGGISVHYHMLSTMSKGLFHRAIAQSGVVISPFSLEKKPRDVAYRVAKALGFRGEHAEDLLEFLRTMDDMKLVKASMEHGFTDEDKDRVLKLLFPPVVEVEAEDIERFLPASPMELLEEGRYHALPFMTGTTDREGLLLFMFADLRKSEVAAKREQILDKIVLPELRLPKNYKKGSEVISKVRHFYLKDKPLSPENLDGFVDLLTDIWFAEPTHDTLKKMAQFGKAPVYNYAFTFDGKENIFKIIKKIDQPGACHGDEIGYLFRAPTADLDLPDSSPETIFRKRFVKLWANFAKTGNPTPEADPDLPLTWPPYTTLSPSYLDINKELHVKQHLFKERMEFWEELYRAL